MSPTEITLPSPAKLNLFLHINGRRADGYHELQTLFQILDYGDRLSLKLRGDGQIKLLNSLPGVPNEKNLVVIAANKLQQHFGAKQGVDISLKKKLPMGGGIGGGSSNAASVLLGLNLLWGINADLPTLCQLGVSLGADLPVFINGETVWAEGIGERFSPIKVANRWYLVVIPPVEVSTAEIFSHQQLTRNTDFMKIPPSFEQGGHNDCEPIVRELYPEVDFALNWLSQHSPARLTGTGACVFAGFETEREATAILQQLPEQLKGFVAKGVDRSPVHQALEQMGHSL